MSKYSNISVSTAWCITASIGLMATTFTFVGRQESSGTMIVAALESSFYATICAMPVLGRLLLERQSIITRLFIGLWWPLKLIFTLYYFFSIWDGAALTSPYMKYSDIGAWHELTLRLVNYWETHGVGFVPQDTLFRMSIYYPGANYFFGLIYLCFGPYIVTVLPWLSLAVFLSAVLSQQLLLKCGLPLKEARFACHLLLWSPFMWLLTLIAHRDPLIIFSWIAVAYSIIGMFQRFNLWGLLVLCLSTYLLVNLRAEYFYIELAWFLAVVVISLKQRKINSFLSKAAFFLSAVLCIFFIIYSLWYGGGSWYTAKYDLASGPGERIESYREGGTTGSGFYGRFSSMGGGVFTLLVLPFKLLLGLTAPFPWRFDIFEHCVTQPFFSAESILRIALFYFTLRSIPHLPYLFKKWSIETILLLLLGLLVGIAGLLGPHVAVRYITPAIPLICPIFTAYAIKHQSWIEGIIFSVGSISLLHLLYAGLRGGL